MGAFSTERLWREIAEGSDPDQTIGHTRSGAVQGEWSADFNVAPTKMARVLLERDDVLELGVFSWGLRQRWSSQGRAPQLLINARSETVLEKPSFRHLVGPNRCVVPMDGFYEWRRSAGDKQPFFCERTDGRLMLVAGIWDSSRDEGGRPSFCILTRESGADLSDIHDRCPVHLTKEDAIEWLSAETPPVELCSVDTGPSLRCRQVSRLVNAVRNNGPHLLDNHTEGGSSGAPTLF